MRIDLDRYMKMLIMQVSNETNYLILFEMVSFVYFKIQCCYLLDDIQNFPLKVTRQD